MMELERALNVAAVAAFGAMIAFPLLTLHTEVGRVSVLENKVLAELPSISAENLFTRQFTEALDTYFTDRIGMKDEATLLHIGAMYRLFDRLAIPNYIIGKEQHVFYITPSIMETFQRLDHVSEEDLRKLGSRIECLSDSLQAAGKTFIFMPIPNKEAIYGEYMPDNIHVMSYEPMLSSFSDYLRKQTTVCTVDTENALFQHKEDSQLLYYRNIDATHWNHYGMLWGYQALMDQICVKAPSVKRINSDEIIIEREDTHSAFLSLQKYDMIQDTFSDLNDYNYNITPIDGWHARKNNAMPGCVLSEDSQNRYFHYHNDVAINDKSIIVCGDSYIWSFMLPLLGESFSDVYFVAASCSADEISNVLSVADPDIIVFETVARMVNYKRLEQLIETLCDACNEAMQLQNLNLIPVAADKESAFQFDNTVINETHTISLSENRVEGNIQITGWTADFAAQAPTGKVWFKIGNTYYSAEQVERPDLEEAFRMSGYRICFPESLLAGISTVEAIALTEDGLARFPTTLLQLIP